MSTHPIAERLRTYRTRAKLSQGDLAALTGVSRPLISKYERGEADPSASRVAQLAAALGVGPGALYDDGLAAGLEVLRLTSAEMGIGVVDLPVVTVDSAARPGPVRMEDITNVFAYRRDQLEAVVGPLASYDEVLEKVCMVYVSGSVDPHIRSARVVVGRLALIDRRSVSLQGGFLQGGLYLLGGVVRPTVRRVFCVDEEAQIYVTKMAADFDDTGPVGAALGDRPLGDLIKGRCFAAFEFDVVGYRPPVVMRRWVPESGG